MMSIAWDRKLLIHFYFSLVTFALVIHCPYVGRCPDRQQLRCFITSLNRLTALSLSWSAVTRNISPIDDRRGVQCLFGGQDRQTSVPALLLCITSKSFCSNEISRFGMRQFKLHPRMGLCLPSHLLARQVGSQSHLPPLALFRPSNEEII